MGEINKLKDAGIYTVKSLQQTTGKSLLS